jgi:alpha-glucosidase
MLKPLVYFDQDDIQTFRNDEFIFGKLSLSILEPNSLGRRMYVPHGNWFNWTNKSVKEVKKCG